MATSTSQPTPRQKALITRYFTLKEEHKALEADLQDLKDKQTATLDKLAATTDHEPAVLGHHKLSRVQRLGTPAYGQIVKHYLPDLDLTPFRGAPVDYWRLS